MKALRLLMLAVFVTVDPGFLVNRAWADCSLTYTGNVPLMDMGTMLHLGYPGGLYPGSLNTVPAATQAAAIDRAANQIKPLNTGGKSDPTRGKIVLLSIGMSNTSMEFDGIPDAFKPRADTDNSKNPKLVIVNGAQGGMDAKDWSDPLNAAWKQVSTLLNKAGVKAPQVQIVWLKEALAVVSSYGAFPSHAITLQSDLEAIARNILTNYPNAKLVYISTRTRAYTTDPATVNPEPYAYETGFGVKWTIEDQINGVGNVNYDSSKGPVVAPLML
jgi:hypothetical protein